MSDTLLDFFYERSNALKNSTGFTSISDSKVVAKFNFKVSNFKTDEENTIEINSLVNLEIAVKSYYEDTESDFKNFIHIPELLKEYEKMFVHLQLP